MTIIRFYVFRQFVLTLATLALILMVITVADGLFQLARANISLGIAIQVFSANLLSASVEAILPISVYLGLFIVIGRMCQFSELHTIYGCGIASAEVRKVLILSVLPILLFCSLMSWFVLPKFQASLHEYTLRSQHEKINDTLNNSGIVNFRNFTAMHLDKSNSSAETKNPDEDILLITRKGRDYVIHKADHYQRTDSESDVTYQLDQGKLYYRQSETDLVGAVEFDRAHYTLADMESASDAKPLSKDVFQLWQSGVLRDKVALQKRFLLPVLLLITFIFAIYCAEILPRQSAFAHFPQALIMLGAVFFVNRYGDNFVNSGLIAINPGMWFYLPIIIGLALLLLRHRAWR